MKKYIGKILPDKAWLDFNGDGETNFQDFKDAAKSIFDTVTPSRNILDINGDGKVDIQDAIDAAKISGAAIAGVGVTITAGALAGSAVVTGTATSIASVVAATVGAGASAGAASIFGATSTFAYAATQTASGVWIIQAASYVGASTELIAAASSLGATITASISPVVQTIAGLPVVQQVALSHAVHTGDILLIAGIPIAREVAIFVGLVAVVVVAGYAFYVLTRKRVSKDEIETLAATPLPT